MGRITGWEGWFTPALFFKLWQKRLSRERGRATLPNL